MRGTTKLIYLVVCVLKLRIYLTMASCIVYTNDDVPMMMMTTIIYTNISRLSSLLILYIGRFVTLVERCGLVASYNMRAQSSEFKYVQVFDRAAALYICTF